ncbi:MAG: hypothetical protein WAN11_06365 [Syntrophobacteraceae bacterium]
MFCRLIIDRSGRDAERQGAGRLDTDGHGLLNDEAPANIKEAIELYLEPVEDDQKE